MTEARRTAYLARARRAIYWALPVVLLAIIFRQLDTARFIEIVQGVNVGLLIVALLAYPSMVLVGAVRWQRLLQLYLKQPVPFGFVLKHYYIGLSIGLFAPASAGWDIYRVVVAGKRLGAYRANIAVVVVEKIMAVLAMITAIVVVYPLVRGELKSNVPFLRELVQVAYAVALIVLALAVVAILIRQKSVVVLLAKRIDGFARMLLAKLGRTALAAPEASQTGPGLVELVARPFTDVGAFLVVAGLSILVQAISSASGYFMFLALKTPVPMLVNLFVTPLMLVAFMLPISFGSIGIREGAHVVLFGLFGVSSEAALAVSFFGLAGMLLNQAIGAVVIWFGKSEPATSSG
jgi:glycosyltransferase 2 family protein